MSALAKLFPNATERPCSECGGHGKCKAGEYGIGCEACGRISGLLAEKFSDCAMHSHGAGQESAKKHAETEIATLREALREAARLLQRFLDGDEYNPEAAPFHRVEFDAKNCIAKIESALAAKESPNE